MINFVVSWPCLLWLRFMESIVQVAMSSISERVMFPLRIIIFKLQSFRTKMNE